MVWLYHMIEVKILHTQHAIWCSLNQIFGPLNIDEQTSVICIHSKSMTWRRCILMDQKPELSWSVRHRVQKTAKSRSLKKFDYTQDYAVLFRPNCCPLTDHLWLSWLLHLNTPFPWCKILYIDACRETCVYCSFCINLRRIDEYFFASGKILFFFTH